MKKVLWNNQIAEFSDHQYLQKKSININEFLHGDGHQRKFVSETTTFGSLWPGVTSQLQTYLRWPVLPYPLDTEHELNIYKTFRRSSGSLLKVLGMLNLRLVSRWQVGLGKMDRLEIEHFLLNLIDQTSRYRVKCNPIQ